MRKLIFVTQQVDPEHPVLAATVRKVQALAERVDELVILADGVVPAALPKNVRAYRFAAPFRLRRLERFERALIGELWPRPIGIVAHMCPIYAVAAAPLARPLGVPVALWFTHWKRSRLLVVADRVSTRAFSVDSRTYPVRSRKLIAIGHGIDVSEFACLPRPEPNGGLRVLSLGRTSPAKGLDVVLEAVEIAGARGLDVSVDLYGPSLTDEERRHRAELEERAARLDGKVRILDAVSHERVPGLLAQSDCLVNNMREGATDKVVYEAAASCLPVLASNTAFEDVLGGVGLDFPRADAAALATRFAEVAAMSKEQRAATGATLRERVVSGHSVDAWAEKLLAGLA